MRERLIQFITDAMDSADVTSSAEIADYLLDNGVIVPPVKVGQTVWYIKGGYYNAAVKRACEKEITEINIKRQSGRVEWGFIADGTRYKFSSIGKTVFLTREAAEEELKAKEYEKNH